MSNAERWTIQMGDELTFTIRPVRADAGRDFDRDEMLSGSFPSRLAALENVEAIFRSTKRDYARAVARVAAMRRREEKKRGQGRD